MCNEQTALFSIDTHVLIWFQENSSQLSRRVLELISNPDNTILFSQVSLFEIPIKLKISKLDSFIAFVNDIYTAAIADDFEIMPFKNQHIYKYNEIPLFANNRDPFDRLLIATAHEEQASLISIDEKLSLYENLIEVIL